MSLLPTSITIDPDTGYGFIDSTWGRVELDPPDTVRVTERIEAAIHEAEDAAFAEPLADTTRVLSSYAGAAAAARHAVEKFAAEMWSAGPFRVAMGDEAEYTLIDEYGNIMIGIDPARPVGSDEWVDTIAPLPNIEEI